MKSEISESAELRTNKGLSDALIEKRRLLDQRLRETGRLMVAYSGGIDSAFLAYAAQQVLGDEMLAVIADSPSLSRAHLRDAVEFAEQQGIPLHVVDTNELENPEYARNDGEPLFSLQRRTFQSDGECWRPFEVQQRCLWNERRRSGRLPTWAKAAA
jgi:3'-phosphoadenosine 5'-phosphosulfate sulfotransferase (PAPS reductase)/FAD synthetase